MTANPATTIDVRNVVRRERHGLLCKTFADLAPGDAYVRVNDHGPKPLFYQFQAELPGQFEWLSLQRGGKRWQVRTGTSTR
jgi:uncharacterized protein (DUF2249 family)